MAEPDEAPGPPTTEQAAAESVAALGAVTGGAVPTEPMVISIGIPLTLTVIVLTNPRAIVAVPLVVTGTAPPSGAVNAKSWPEAWMSSLFVIALSSPST